METHTCPATLTTEAPEPSPRRLHAVFESGLAYQVVDATVDSPADIEHRLAQAQKQNP